MSAAVIELRPGISACPAVRPRVRLGRPAQLDVDQAELFLLSLEGEFDREPTVARLSWLMGTAEGHLANLLEIVRGLSGAGSTTEV
jgi:hypothetical protein